MTQPIDFTSGTAKFALPLLFPGQAQKEFTLNHALTLLDTLLLMAVVGSQATPPAVPSEGDAYRITVPASGAWSGKEDAIALRIGEGWKILDPLDGMRIYDQSAGQMLCYHSQWRSASEPALPTGGTVVDVEARSSIAEIVDAMRAVGLIPMSS